MVFVLNIFYVWKNFKLDMLQGKTIFVLFLWRYSAKSVTFFFSWYATNISNEIRFSVNLYEAIYFKFFVLSFCPSHPGKRCTATNDDIISLPWKHPLDWNSPCRGEGASHQEVSTRVCQREELNWASQLKSSDQQIFSTMSGTDSPLIRQD